MLSAIYEQNYHISMKKIIFKKISSDLIQFFMLSMISISTIIWVLQAVNYLDFVIEDGHGFLVYLKYTLLSFPKILSKIFPFTMFFATIYILLKYENKNELVIFWNFGISKIKFINFFIKFSIIFLIFNLILNAIIVPTAQEKARSFIRSSDLDFFESILKPKKFIDVVKNLTIYFDEKTNNGELKNIFLKDNSKKNEFQVTFAKVGKFEFRDNIKILTLYNGKTITGKNGTLSEFEFSKTDFNIARFGSNTISVPKTQENSTIDLIKCVLTLESVKHIKKDYKKSYIFNNCKVENLENVYKELYRRLILPFYNPLLVMMSLLIILKSKDDSAFNSYKFKIFIFGFLFIIFLEASLKFISSNLVDNFLVFALPFILFFTMYIYFISKLIFKKL